MVNKNLIASICATWFNENQAFAMEGNVEEVPEQPKPLIIEHIKLNQKEDTSIDSLDLSPKRQKISKTLPLNRRKSSGLLKGRTINLPKSISSHQIIIFLDDQQKGSIIESKEPLSSSQDEQNGSLKWLLSTSQLKEKESSTRLGFKKYSLIGPIEFLQIPFTKPSGLEQKDLPISSSNSSAIEK